MKPPPSLDRARLMRGVGNAVGSEQLARDLGVAPRTVYALMNGERRVSDAQLHAARARLIDYRSAVSWLLGAIRKELHP